MWRARSLRALGLLLAFCCGCAGNPRDPDVSATRRASFEPATVTLPRSYEGQVVKGSVRLTNPSNGPMTASNWNTSCGCLHWTEPTSAVLAAGQTVDLSFSLDTRGMLGKLSKELIVELDDAIGVHSCPVKCEVIAPSNLPILLKLGLLPKEVPKTINLDVEPGPSGAEVRLGQVRSDNSSLRWVKTKPKTYPSGLGAAVQFELTPVTAPQAVVQLEVQIDFDLPARVTQKMKIEYENSAP